VTIIVFGDPKTPEGDVAVTITVADLDAPGFAVAVMVKLPGVVLPDEEVVNQSASSETVYVMAVPELDTVTVGLVPPSCGAVHEF
jgi:hypothetical protein